MADNTNGLPLDPRLQAPLMDIYGMSRDRLGRTEPIHQAAMAMAQHMAPGYAQDAMGPIKPYTDPNTIKALGNGPNGANGSGGGSATAAFFESLLSALGSGASGEFGNLIRALINHFRNRGGTVQGNKPFAGGALPSGNPGMNGFTGWAGNEGQDPTRWPGGGGPEPNVSTDTSFSFPLDILNDPTFLNSLNNFPTDPSGGTGIGPGMQGYYGTGGGGEDYGDPFAERP